MNSPAATSLSGWVNALLLGWALHRRGHFLFDDKVKRNMPLVLVAAAAMGLSVFLAAWWAEPYFADQRILFRAVAMGTICGIGLLLFALFCQLAGVVHFGAMIGKLRNRGRR